MNTRKKGAQILQKAPAKNILNSNQISHFHSDYYYNIMPNNILLIQNLKPVDKILLMMVFTFNYQGKQFYQSNKKIAHIINVSKSTIINSITRLINNNYVKCGYLQLTTNIYRRYIFLNVDKVLGKPDKSASTKFTNSSYKPTTTHSTASRTTTYTCKPNSKTKPITPKQLKQIEKSLQVIRENVSHINLKNSKSRFINEYKNGNLNFDNLNDALIVYQYEKQIKHKLIHSNVGYICKLTQDTFNKNNITQLKNKLINKSKSHLKQNKQENSNDYGYSKPSKSFKDKYYKKHGFKYGNTSKDVLKHLVKEYKIDFTKPFKPFKNHLNTLTDKQIISSGQHNILLIHYFNRNKNK